MRVLEAATYRGPHLYAAQPMVRIQLDLGRLEGHPTSALPGFAAQLLSALPGLQSHGCSYAVPGGFARRMHEGTWLGHVIEHVALEFQKSVGALVSRGKTRSVRDHPGVYNILYAYESERLGRSAGRAAVELVQSLLPASLQGMAGLELIAPAWGAPGPGGFDLAQALEHLRATGERERLGPTTSSLVREARRRGIPCRRLDEQSLVQLGWGARRQLLRASITGRSSHIAVQTAGDKALTKALLAAVGVPVPVGGVVRTLREALAAASRVGGPVVVKPLDANHGRGVSLGLETAAQVRWGFEQARKHGRRVIVEEQYAGRDYRILVIGGHVAAVAERVPARVLGDGRSTISQLIEAANEDPRRGVGHQKIMTRILVDDHVRQVLARAELSLDDVPAPGAIVRLRDTANLSTGGSAIDRTEDIHPENAAIARRAALTVGLDVAGIDLVAPDIGRSVRDTGGGVVEVNAAPGFRMHLEPCEGRGRDVAKAVISHLFPPGARSRIPIVAVTGTNGKSTVVRMIALMVRQMGKTVGLTSTTGVYVDGERIVRGDASGPRSARLVLADPTVEVAVLETARGGLLREGLAFDRCDVGVVLNITADHLGLKGVNTLEDLAAVKSIVTESVARRGLSVLNADDELTRGLDRRAGGRIAYFTLEGGAALSQRLQRHVADGGVLTAVEPSASGDVLVLYAGGERTPVMGVGEIPATLDGLARFNVANALAAIAAGHGLGAPPATMAAALRGFTSSHAENPGRFNVHDEHGFRVIVDYAHNPGALRAVKQLVLGLRPQVGAVIGVVSIPGDRRDQDILEMGAIAGAMFDELIFRERPDGRGRPSGSVISLLTQGALAAGFPPDRLHRIFGEADAVRAALATARPGDLVLIFPTAVEAVWRQVLEFRPAVTAEASPGQTVDA